jgi:hypothetical protein
MNKKPLFWCLIFLVVASFSLSAQKFSVKTHIDSTTMWIGNQTKLSFQVTQPKYLKVTFPAFADTLTGGLEIVGKLKVDTVLAENGNILVTQSYNITGFEDSLITIPSYAFASGTDTTWSNSLSLQIVQPYQIDTAKNKIKDIKPVFNAPIYWWGIIRIVLLVLLILALLVAAYFVFRKYFTKKNIGEKKKRQPDLPAYVIAINKLDKVKEEKIWHKNRSKEYHTIITDIIREYIERTFDINSMEMTSEEILEQLRYLKFEQKGAYISLEQILHLADLVKFAKFEPKPDEHELSLMNSYLFVNQTKVEETPALNSVKEESEPEI